MTKILTSYHSLGRESLKPIGSPMPIKSVVTVGMHSPGRILYLSNPVPSRSSFDILANGQHLYWKPSHVNSKSAPQLSASSRHRGLAANRTIREMVSGVQGVFFAVA